MIFAAVNTYTPLVYIIGAMFAGGLIPLAYNMLRNWRRAPIEDSQIIASNVRNDVSGLKDLLAEYRIEVELNKRQLEDYRGQLGQITIELAKAQARISLLEQQLSTARNERDQILGELDGMRARRDELAAERERLKEEAAALQGRIKALEDQTGITERLATLRAEP